MQLAYVTSTSPGFDLQHTGRSSHSALAIRAAASGGLTKPSGLTLTRCKVEPPFF